ncbi:hypothetical protein ES703_57922 [subsurface metagenome]
MNQKSNGDIKVTLIIPKEYKGIEISKSEAQTLQNKLEPDGSVDILLHINKLIRIDEIIIVDLRHCDIFGREIPIDNVVPAFIEMVVAPPKKGYHQEKPIPSHGCLNYDHN